MPTDGRSWQSTSWTPRSRVARRERALGPGGVCESDSDGDQTDRYAERVSGSDHQVRALLNADWLSVVSQLIPDDHIYIDRLAILLRRAWTMLHTS